MITADQEKGRTMVKEYTKAKVNFLAAPTLESSRGNDTAGSTGKFREENVGSMIALQLPGGGDESPEVWEKWTMADEIVDAISSGKSVPTEIQVKYVKDWNPAWQKRSQMDSASKGGLTTRQANAKKFLANYKPEGPNGTFTYE